MFKDLVSEISVEANRANFPKFSEHQIIKIFIYAICYIIYDFVISENFQIFSKNTSH